MNKSSIALFALTALLGFIAIGSAFALPADACGGAPMCGALGLNVADPRAAAVVAIGSGSAAIISLLAAVYALSRGARQTLTQAAQ